MSFLLRPASRSLLRSAVTAGRASGSRSLHHLPPLPSKLTSDRACDPLFTAATLNLLWNDWHKGLLDKLNEQVRGTEYEHKTIVETVIGLAQDPEQATAFNLASQALNNSFFIFGLRPKDLGPNDEPWHATPPNKPPRDLATAIRENFDSIPAFKDAFSATVEGMAGSGWVWLVQDGNGKLGIVPTFAAGTVLVQNRQQRQMDDTKPSLTEEEVASAEQFNARSAVQALASKAAPRTPSYFSPTGVDRRRGASESAISQRSLGNELYPLMCCSVHEHDWLPLYGMHGKEQYLQRFWESVDWARAGRLHSDYADNLMPTF